MSAKIARGAPQRSRPKAKGASKGKGRKNEPPSALPEAVRRVSGWIFAGMLLAVTVAALVALHIPQMVGYTLGEAAGKAGFSVRGYEIRGLTHMDRARVDAVIGDALKRTRAQPLVDLEAIRQQLLLFGWVRDARVSRRLPDTLVIDIVERQPKAIWQNQGLLMLIDLDGVVLDHVRLEAMPDLPVVIGPAANHHAAELARLVAAAPQLRAMMAGATWVGGRRWDIRFQSGETLALPEGEEASQKALAYFARMDQSTQLLGRGFPRFDMRIPGKFIVRVSNVPGGAVSEPVSQAPPAAAPAAPPSAPANRGDSDIDTSKTI